MVYLVEAFLPRGQDTGWSIADRALDARDRARVRLIARLRVPADEVVFWLFDAATREELSAVLTASGIDGNRVTEVSDLLLVPDGEAGRPQQVEGGPR